MKVRSSEQNLKFRKDALRFLNSKQLSKNYLKVEKHEPQINEGFGLNKIIYSLPSIPSAPANFHQTK